MQIDNRIAGLRQVYQLKTLSKKDVLEDPFRQFDVWWQEAIESKVYEPNAMTLATCNTEGRPSARTVLLKGIHENGFTFYTNYNSKKAEDLKQNPQASLLFFWKELERQIRIEGTVQKLSGEESDAYFASRPRQSQLGAWASPQSKTIPSRKFLQDKEQQIEKEYADQQIPRPSFWGGYLLVPDRIEYWQGRPGRLHDRILYSATHAGWKIERLAP